MARPGDPSAKSRLLKAAEAVFIERGLDRAKVDDIAHAAGLSKGSFYLHFKSKDEAFKEILSGVLGVLGENLGEIEASRSEWATRTFESLVEYWFEQDLKIFEYIWERRALMRLVLEGGGSPDYQHLMNLFAQRAEDTVAGFIRYGMERGYYRSDIDPVHAAAFVAGGYDRVARRLVREPVRPDIRLWIAEAQSLCLRGLGTPAFVTGATNFYAKVLSESLGRKTSA